MKEYSFTGKPLITEQDIDYVKSALLTNNLNTGTIVKKFEKSLEKYINVKHAVLVSNGSVALYLALKALGIKQGDEVITTPLTYIATTNAISLLGAKPIFADIDRETFQLDPNKVEEKISKKTQAILPVDLGGNTCEYKKFTEICKRYNLKLLIDSAQSLSAKYDDKYACSFGDIATTSFHPVKPITTGIGGCIFTQNDEIYSKLLCLRKNGLMYGNYEGIQIYDCIETSLNYQMSDIEAALGLSQLTRIDEMRKKRKKIFDAYKAKIDLLPHVTLQKAAPYIESSYHLCLCKLDSSIDRDDLFNYMQSKKIAVNYHYPLICNMSNYKEIKSYDLKNAREYASHAISLPLHTQMKESDVEYVIENLETYLNKKGKSL